MKYSTLACTGPDAKTYLQGQLTCDMNEIGPDKLSMGCYCTLKGRILAVLYIYSVPGGFHLILPADLAPVFIKALSRMMVFSKVSITDISTELPAIPVLGAAQYEIVPGAGFTLGNAEPAPEEAWLAYLIQHKIPTIALAQSERFLPHYIGMVDLGAISFTKGCYLGQEIIARMHYKGQLKKNLNFIQGPSPQGSETVNEVIFEGKRYTLFIANSPVRE